MSDLHVADGLALPLDAVTRTFAILAKKGSGKTYTASVFAEELIQAGQHFCAIDPMGVWWGLKASADGTGPGFPVVVLGGEHADLPLTPEMGSALAEFVTGETLCCILDVAELAREQQYRVIAEFTERLYVRNREPLMLLVDEADEFAPQVPERAQRRVLGAMDRLVRRGRVRGIGCTLISQRPASLNKNVLSQTEVLLALQLTSAQDRRAIEAWVSAQADSEQQQEMMATLAGLDVGEAWAWSPSWLRVLQRVRIRRRLTFDSSATPSVGQRIADPVVLAAPDVARLRERLERVLTTGITATAAENVDNPTLLKERLAILHRELRVFQERPESLPRVERVIEHIEVPVLLPEQVERLTEAVTQLRAVGDQVVAVAEQVRSALDAYQPAPVPDDERTARTASDGREERNESGQHVLMPAGPLPVAARRSARRATSRSLSKPVERPDDDGHPALAPRTRLRNAAHASPAHESPALSAPQQRILDALTAFEALGLTAVARSHVAVFSRQSPRSSGFGNNLGRLHTRQLITYPRSGQVAVTEAGRRLATHALHITSVSELHAAWLAMLPNPQTRILRVLLVRYPESLERSAVATAAGQSPPSSGFGNNLGALRSLGLIDYPQHGHVAATTLLFPETSPAMPTRQTGSTALSVAAGEVRA